MIRWRPKHGKPRTGVEAVIQHMWRRRILYYIAAVTTTSLVLQLTWGH